MELYSVKKGKYYFKGNKIQSAYFQFGLTALGIILSITYGNLWFLAASAVIFSIFGYYILEFTNSNSMRVFFKKNCTYKLEENFDQVNKLFGFSEGFHHWNSARIGWRSIDGETIELIAYCYINGKRIIKPMIKCKPEEWVFCNIQNKPSKYVLKAMISEGDCITVSVDKDKKISIYSFFKLFIYRLFPYFGGKIAAPHDMELCLIKLHLQ